MKIAEVVNTFPPYHGGMGYVCFHHAHELARRGHDVTVFTLQYDQVSGESDPEGVEVVRLSPVLRHGDGAAIPQLYTRLRGFECIHVHCPFYGGAEYVYLASLIRKQPYLLTYHTDVYGDTLLKKLVLGLYEPLLTRRIVKGAARISSTSQVYLQQSKISSWVDWNKVVDMQHAGVDTQKFFPRPRNNALVEQYGLEDKTVALFVGNLLPLKGVHLLIEAISNIQDDSIRLLIVGGGYAEETYKRRVKEQGLEQKIIFVGPRSPDGDLPDYYNLSDFLVLPSTHSESFGLVILEAIASGKPAIVSSLPGPSQLIENGVDGLITTAGDVEDLRQNIEALARNRDLCAAMGAAARKKVEARYTWDTVGAQLETTFHQMLSC